MQLIRLPKVSSISVNDQNVLTNSNNSEMDILGSELLQ